MGVPTIGCDCDVCTSPHARDRRLRPSVLVQYEGHNVLIDTTPDFRQQALRAKIRTLDAVLYTHAHADHILGLDDVRPISFRNAEKLPLYAGEHTGTTLRHIFKYIFDNEYKFGGMARVELNHVGGGVDLPHEETNARLPENVRLAYDGLELEFEI